MFILIKESIVSKGQDSKKDGKKKPLLTAKEKRTLKIAKKSKVGFLAK